MGKIRSFKSKIRAASAVLLAVGICLVWLPRVAFGSYPQDSVTVYTGCLTPGGTVTAMMAGQTPSKPCVSPQVVVHLSGGTITQVAAGNGLTGGGNNGYVSLGLNGSYQLPQNCSDGQIIKWNASHTAWGCANDQTYTNGTGLDLNGNAFSVSSAYQLPQTCAAGQFPSANGAGTSYGCGTDKTYSGTDFATSNQSCSAGRVVTGVDANGHLACSQAASTTTHGYSAFDSHVIDAAAPNTQDLATISGLPAGNYLVWGTVGNSDFGGFTNGELDCDLFDSNGDILNDENGHFVVHADNGLATQVSEVGLPDNSSITLRCGTANPGNQEAITTLIALPVGALN